MDIGYWDIERICQYHEQYQISNIKYQITNMSKTVDFKKSIQALSAEDLTARIQEDELRLKKLEFAHAISPLENPMTIRNLRREMARLKTELKKKQQG
jgi:large subunit ribosomal protein L29